MAKRITPQQEQAFAAGIAFERNRTIDFIQEQITTCPVGIEECAACQQDARLINALLENWNKNENN